MHSVESIAAEIVRREGGFVNDPDDPGGATNHGVTIHTMQRLGIDLTGDGKVDVADVRALTPAQAAEIYVRHYFQEPKLNLLPAPLQPSVFDMQVNAGANAVRILQRLTAAFGLPLKDDGVIGPVTARTVARGDGGGARPPGRRLRHRPAQLLLPPRRPAAGEPQVRARQRRRQGRLDRPRRGVHRRALPPDPRRARREGGGMGVIGTHPRRRRAARAGRRGRRRRRRGLRRQPRRARGRRGRGARAAPSASSAPSSPRPATGRFDRFVNALNRLPRPLLALGTLGLFVYAMAEPAGFSVRMQGLALVPEPLWWLLGAIVSFYFGARDDTVLYFEGERHHSHRVVRAVKNRFGAASELGVFEMTSEGLMAVPNPSALFLSERPTNTPGSAVHCSVEGSRPLLVEVQALVSSQHVRQCAANGLGNRSGAAVAAPCGAREARGPAISSARTCSSMWPEGCDSTSRPPTSAWRRPWRRACAIAPWPSRRRCSGRSDWQAKCAEFRKRGCE